MLANTEAAEVEKGMSGARLAVRHSVHATLRLEFTRDSATGQTMLAASHQEPPLRVVRAFESADGTALVHLHNLSGGLLGGDDLTLDVTAAAETNVQITTTGATRIYRARPDAQPATQRNEISVGKNALLEYLPDAVIPFAGARFSQRTSIRLEEGAGLFWWEILAPGREARGEIFEYESVELKSNLSAAGKRIAAERLRLEPKQRAMASPARMGAHRTWATFYICRASVAPTVWLELESEVRSIASEFGGGRDALWGVSTLTAHGIAVRCLTRNARDIAPGLQAIWTLAKRKLYGRRAVAPRKVN